MTQRSMALPVRRHAHLYLVLRPVPKTLEVKRSGAAPRESETRSLPSNVQCNALASFINGPCSTMFLRSCTRSGGSLRTRSHGLPDQLAMAAMPRLGGWLSRSKRYQLDHGGAARCPVVCSVMQRGYSKQHRRNHAGEALTWRLFPCLHAHAAGGRGG
jgi:hypothetical protein